MKPVWIVDDDQSIRWVLEKALAREAIPAQAFSSADEMLDALAGQAPSVLVTMCACRVKTDWLYYRKSKRVTPICP